MVEHVPPQPEKRGPLVSASDGIDAAESDGEKPQDLKSRFAALKSESFELRPMPVPAADDVGASPSRRQKQSRSDKRSGRASKKDVLTAASSPSDADEPEASSSRRGSTADEVVDTKRGAEKTAGPDAGEARHDEESAGSATTVASEKPERTDAATRPNVDKAGKAKTSPEITKTSPEIRGGGGAGLPAINIPSADAAIAKGHIDSPSPADPDKPDQTSGRSRAGNTSDKHDRTDAVAELDAGAAAETDRTKPKGRSGSGGGDSAASPPINIPSADAAIAKDHIDSPTSRRTKRGNTSSKQPSAKKRTATKRTAKVDAATDDDALSPETPPAKTRTKKPATKTGTETPQPDDNSTNVDAPAEDAPSTQTPLAKTRTKKPAAKTETETETPQPDDNSKVDTPKDDDALSTETSSTKTRPKKPVAKKRATKKPAIQVDVPAHDALSIEIPQAKTLTKKPATKKPATKKPATKKPAPKKPATKERAAKAETETPTPGDSTTAEVSKDDDALSSETTPTKTPTKSRTKKPATKVRSRAQADNPAPADSKKRAPKSRKPAPSDDTFIDNDRLTDTVPASDDDTPHGPPQLADLADLADLAETDKINPDGVASEIDLLRPRFGADADLAQQFKLADARHLRFRRAALLFAAAFFAVAVVVFIVASPDDELDRRLPERGTFESDVAMIDGNVEVVRRCGADGFQAVLTSLQDQQIEVSVQVAFVTADGATLHQAQLRSVLLEPNEPTNVELPYADQAAPEKLRGQAFTCNEVINISTQ